ncbi:MAG TPA: DinB family protein [Acidimicrobiia bacterium]|nr:DinB family protein [Acidimicrobiia bacterium]
MTASFDTVGGMIDSYTDAPPRLAPFLAQWDYVTEQLFSRLDGLSDQELLWEPAPGSWTVRRADDGSTQPTSGDGWWAAAADPEPPRTLAWSMGHLGAGSLIRADWLVGSHQMVDGPDWPITADQSLEFLRHGLDAWRSGLDQMCDEDLDTVGRSAYPGGLDPQLPLLDIVWWVNKELLWHAAEIWYVRDLYGALMT